MNLDSFEEEIESPIILSRGLSYYRGKNVVSLEMIEANHYKAFVAGTQLYEVTLTLDDDGEVEDIHCTCPYDWGEHCKHEVAVLYALRHQLNKEQHEMVERPKDVDLSSLLEKRSKVGMKRHKSHVILLYNALISSSSCSIYCISISKSGWSPYIISLIPL